MNTVKDLNFQSSTNREQALLLEIERLTKRLLPTQRNPLLALDVYKMGHLEQYAPGCTKVFAYLMARTPKTYSQTVFNGLQYYLMSYLSTPLTRAMGAEFLDYREEILGGRNPAVVVERIYKLCDLGYWPLEIRAVPEGTIMPTRNVLMTTTNTHPDFFWVGGFLESLLLKVWDPISTASCSFVYRQMVEDAFRETVSDNLQFLKKFMVHDFGYRGCKSEEEACITGLAHLIFFNGSDTVPALPFARQYYDALKGEIIMTSVPASEHAVMCSYGRDEELEGFFSMLRLYPSGIVSIVSDTYNIYRVLTEFAEKLKSTILARPEGSKVVFRPDSGNPEYIICGDPTAPLGSNEWKGAIRLLDEMFGSTINGKGYKELNPKVGLIYGDGMYIERYASILRRLKEMGYAASNLVIGVGGILRHHSRDTLGFALKSTYVEVYGEPREIEKDPITDSKKKSHKGLVTLRRKDNGEFETVDQCTFQDIENGFLIPVVYRNGQVLQTYALRDMRALIDHYFI